MRKYLWIVIVFWNLLLGLAQPQNITREHDSLMKILPTLTQDTDRIDVLRGIAKTWISREPAKGLQYMEEALVLSQKINNEYRIVGCMLNLGYQYGNYGETTKAIQILQEVVKRTEKTINKVQR
jgi:lipopolysaccharide biosynthesis regulator YciM